MKRDLEQWIDQGDHLPDFMRDFHDQKNLFKTIDIRVAPVENSTVDKLDWISAHVYTVDTFLRFMARRGYTLQRSRANLEFRDIQQDVKETIADDHRMITNMLLGQAK